MLSYNYYMITCFLYVRVLIFVISFQVVLDVQYPPTLAMFSCADLDLLIYTGYGLKKEICFYGLDKKKVSVYSDVYTCVCVCVYVHVHVRMYVYAPVHVCTYPWICVCLRA